jgi:hypothetical protein
LSIRRKYKTTKGRKSVMTKMKKTTVKKEKGKPEAGKVYLLIGGVGKPCIAAGNTWAECEVKKEGAA